MKELGPFIKAARVKEVLTIREAEELSGISNAYLNQMENGKVKNPSPLMLFKLSQLYQISYEMLLIKAGYPVPDYNINISNDPDEQIIVVIIDNNSKDRESIRKCLENDHSASYTIYEAETGEGAIDFITRIMPDCVLINHRLPDMDGLQLFSKIKRIEAMKTVSMIILTEKGAEETVVDAMRMGAINYLTKDHLNDDILIRTMHHSIRIRKIKENLRLLTLNSKGCNEPTRLSLMEIGTLIREAADRIQEKSNHMKNDPDLLLIIEKSIELAELCREANSAIKAGSDP
jgi:DNA-binding NarL/FixJ family response regulator